MTAWEAQAAVDRFFAAGFEDGDLISHSWIFYALDVERPSTRADSLLLLDRMDAFRQALLTRHHIALQNIRGRGYRVVPPAEQAEFAARTAVAYIDKGLQKGRGLLHHTRMDSLTDRERQRHTDTELRMSGLTRMVGRRTRNVFALFNSNKRKE